jgi:hypothetical protein
VSRGWVIGLGLALVGTNAAWGYLAVRAAADQLSLAKGQGSVEHELRETARAALLALPGLAAELDRPEVVKRVAAAVREPAPYEKEGRTVIGWLALRFGDDGRLVEARSVFEPDLVFEVEPATEGSSP